MKMLLVIGDSRLEDKVRNAATPDAGEILFIGSSLTRSILPATDLPSTVLQDGRSSAIRASNNLSERMSNLLLADAIDARVNTIFLEVNPYAQDWVAFADPEILDPLTLALRIASENLRRAIKSYDEFAVIRLDRDDQDQVLHSPQVHQADYYRLVRFEPDDPDALHSLLIRARDLGVKVNFFSPPRPVSVVDTMGVKEYTNLLDHINQFAASFGVPLWAPSGAWPDDHFKDIHAHLNVRGRKRFQEELAHWYRAKP